MAILLFLIAVAHGFEAPKHPELQLQYEFHKVLRVHRLPEKQPEPEAPKEQVTGWLSRLRPNKLLDALRLLVFPPELQHDYTKKKTLGAGSFGITFLATRKSDGETVAVKLLMLHGLKYLTAKDYIAGTWRELIEMSREECNTLQAIHAADAEDPVAAKHVTKCLYDGITPELKKAPDEALKSTMPLHIVLEFDGTQDVDKWWQGLLQKKLGDKEYVSKIKLMTRDMLRGLQLLGESKTDRQWVHHDLKPMNMVYNEEKDSVVVIDLGTAISSEEPRKQQACTMLWRPPEVGNLQGVPEWGQVGWFKPIWSYDIFSAGATILGIAAIPHPSITILPSITWMSWILTPMKAANMRTLKEVLFCTSKPSDWEICLQAAWKKAAQSVFTERVEMIRATAKKSDARKAALAQLAVCRSYMLFQGDPATHWFPDLRSSDLSDTPPSYLWALLDDWMATGFDEILLQMIEGDPAKRPKPSKILEAEWFKEDCAHCFNGDSKPVEFTCPRFYTSELFTTGSRALWAILVAAAALVLLCGQCVGYCMGQLRAPAWILAMPIGGVLTIVCPWLFFYVMDMPYMWIMVMNLIGIALILGPHLPLEAEQGKKVRVGIIGIACIPNLLRAIFILIDAEGMLYVTGNAVTGYAFTIFILDLVFTMVILLAYAVSASSIMRQEARAQGISESRTETELGPVSTA